MRRAGSATIAAGAVLLAGCGGAGTGPYKLDATKKCLDGAGARVTTRDRDLSVIAQSAPEGALRAYFGTNNVTISFGDDGAEARDIRRAYFRFAPRRLRPHLDDLMELKRNVVLLWDVTPPLDRRQTVLDCLRS